MSRKTNVRPRHLPKTSEYAVRLEITVTRIVTGTVMAMEVVSEFEHASCLETRREQLLVVAERQLRRGRQDRPPPGLLEGAIGTQRDDRDPNRGHEPENCDRREDDVDQTMRDGRTRKPCFFG